MNVEVTTDQALERARRLLSEVPEGVEKALLHSINRAAAMGKAQAVREATGLYTAKAGDIRQTMRIKKATRANFEADIVSRGPVLGLSHYKYAPKTDTTGANRRQVRVAVKREGGLKPLGQAFVWQGKVMERDGAMSLPIRKMVGPSIPGILNNPDIVDAVLDKSEENLVARLDHEVNRILKV